MVSTCRIFWPSTDCAFLFFLFFFFVPIICLSVEVIGSISEGSDVRRPGCSKNSYFHMIRTGSYTRWHIHCCNLSISASLDWRPFVRVSIWRGIHLLTAFREWQYLLTLCCLQCCFPSSSPGVWNLPEPSCAWPKPLWSQAEHLLVLEALLCWVWMELPWGIAGNRPSDMSTHGHCQWYLSSYKKNPVLAPEFTSWPQENKGKIK